MYAPLHYVILFPKGDLGWTWDIPYRDAERVNNNDAEDAMMMLRMPTIILRMADVKGKRNASI
jgi:hypothetical protein